MPRTLPEIMAAYERVVIIQAMQHNGFCRAKTADSLGISRSFLYRRIRLLKINLKEIPTVKRGRPSKQEIAAWAKSMET